MSILDCDLAIRLLDGPPAIGFRCGVEEQDTFLYEHAWGDQQEGVSVTYLYFRARDPGRLRRDPAGLAPARQPRARAEAPLQGRTGREAGPTRRAPRLPGERPGLVHRGRRDRGGGADLAAGRAAGRG